MLECFDHTHEDNIFQFTSFSFGNHAIVFSTSPTVTIQITFLTSCYLACACYDRMENCQCVH